nr:DNA gyrase/topoisomerase IV subunit A [Bacteroidota bacterium]
IHLPSGISPDKTIDALYAFTNCEVSIAPLACSIHEDTPLFIGVKDVLKRSTETIKGVLKAELEVRLSELREQWHFASLERIFIEEKIYRDIEEAETWEQVISFIAKGLEPHIGHLMREVTEEDIVRLTEIKIKRISKFDSDKANDKILDLEGKISSVQHDLAHLVEYAINYFKELKEKFGKGRERKTEIATFDSVEASKVVIRNQKLYVNREEGFVGYGMKRDEYVGDCSDIDDVIVFRADGKYSVSKVKDKAFFGKNIIHVAVWKKGDDRTVYNAIYQDGASKVSYVKRFAVQSITRDREYDVTTGSKGSHISYFTSNPNGEAEKVLVLLRQLAKLKKLKIDLDFANVAVKGRSSKGNIVTKFPVKRIELKEKGESTLEARKVWFDPAVQRLNSDERGRLVGSFKGEDRLLIGMKNGTLRVVIPELNLHFDADMIYLEKLEENRPISAVYFDGEKSRYFVKRFLWEGGDKEENIITAHPKSELSFLSNNTLPRIQMVYRKTKGDVRDPEEVDLAAFISVKGIKAKGNQLTSDTLNKIEPLESLPEPDETRIEVNEAEQESLIVKVEPSTEVETVAKIDAAANVEQVKSVRPTEAEEQSKSATSEPNRDEKSSYDADDKAPQITLDF